MPGVASARGEWVGVSPGTMNLREVAKHAVLRFTKICTVVGNSASLLSADSFIRSL
jgi:hypothetical protein